jgi:SAM-dependent methyltransferase
VPADELHRVHEANRRYHAAMAARYDETQPYFSPGNQGLRGAGPAARLLDIGCGTGFVLRLAEGVFRTCVGVDVTCEMLDRAPRGPGLYYAMATAESLPFADDSFDAVTAYSVLHHLVDLVPVLAEVRRVLRDGGAFYADESPNAACTTALREVASLEGLPDALRDEAETVLLDHKRYQERFGLDEELVRSAMYRKYRFGGIDEDDLGKVLLSVGFTEVRFDYRWPVGSSRMVREAGWEQEQALEAHLRSLLPLSRHLFKYLQVIAS